MSNKRRRKELKRRSNKSKQNPARRHTKGPKLNTKFNRLEFYRWHLYYQEFGFKPQQAHITYGWVKCRLAHGVGLSIIIPEQLFFEDDGLKWIQPLAFLPCLILKESETQIRCTIHVDISCGNRIQVDFKNEDLCNKLGDGSEIFSCTLLGPSNLSRFATGEAEWGHDQIPYIKLFHHSTPDAIEAIKSSMHFHTSSANIQGTGKELKSISYAYFTPLDELKYEADLNQVAMSKKQRIYLCTDDYQHNNAPLGERIKADHSKVLALDVYGSDPRKRRGSIGAYVCSSALAPQHLHQHCIDGITYYAFPHRFIHRVGTRPGDSIVFGSDLRIHMQPQVIISSYVVVGNCSTLEGLAAPYDEEDTRQIFKTERLSERESMLEFWFNQGNRDHFTTKETRLEEF